MNERYSDDLISSYFDAEVSPDERAQAEQRLADSMDVRRELSDYGQLSGFLASLPKERVPDEFCASVMQAAERETLLPPRDVAPVASRPPSRRKKRFWGVATSVTAAAALVIVMVNWFDQPAPERRVAMQQPPRVAESAAENVSADRADYNSLAAKSPDESRVAAAHLPKTDAMVSSPLSADSVAERDESPVVLNAEPERTNSNRSQLKFDDKALSDAAIGEVVEALATADDQIAVVKLTVVDRRKGLESLQLLLARNHIPLETTAFTSDLSANSATESENLLAVYVETDSSQMSSALLDLQNEDLFREVVVQEPIQVASLDSASQSQLGYAAASSGIGGGGVAMSALDRGQRRSRVSGAAPAAENKNRALEEMETKDAGKAMSVAATPHRELARAPASELPTRKKASPASKKLSVQPKPKQALRPTETPRNQQIARLSRQLVLSVPTDLLPANPLTQKGAEQQLLLDGRARKLVTKKGRLSQEATAVARSTVAARPLQILFVLVSNAPM